MVINFDAIDTEALYARPPPKFGHEMLKHFAIEPGYINLNHGSVLAHCLFSTYSLFQVLMAPALYPSSRLHMTLGLKLKQLQIASIV